MFNFLKSKATRINNALATMPRPQKIHRPLTNRAYLLKTSSEPYVQHTVIGGGAKVKQIKNPMAYTASYLERSLADTHFMLPKENETFLHQVYLAKIGNNKHWLSFFFWADRPFSDEEAILYTEKHADWTYSNSKGN